MTEEHDTPVEHLFRAAYTELAEEEFTSRVMDHVRRNQRRSAIYRNVACIGALVVAWFLAPYIQSGSLLISMFPGEATLSWGAELISLAQLPLFYIVGLAAAGFFLLSSESW
jgi:hypothetical protein